MNSPQSSMNSQFENVIKHGTYYYPAERHYYSGCVVRCDRCNRTNLKASIGYHEIDLCLACASQIESLVPRVNPPIINVPPAMPEVGPPFNFRPADSGFNPHGFPSQAHFSSNNGSSRLFGNLENIRQSINTTQANTTPFNFGGSRGANPVIRNRQNNSSNPFSNSPFFTNNITNNRANTGINTEPDTGIDGFGDNEPEIDFANDDTAL